MRTSTYLFFAAITLLVGSLAVITSVPVLTAAWTVGQFLPAGIYATFILAVAIIGPIAFLAAALVSLFLGDDK